MSNSKYFYAGYAIKAHRKLIDGEMYKRLCCGSERNSIFCPNCGTEIIQTKCIKQYYPTAIEFIPDDICDDFFDEFDIIYPEGGVQGLEECECYFVLNKNIIDLSEEFLVKNLRLMIWKYY